MKGTLIDISRGMNNRQRVTVELLGDFREEYDRLKDEAVTVEIKKYRKRRSLDSNAYAWILIDKIAEALNQDKTAVYREAIRNIGGVSELYCANSEEAANRLMLSWRNNGLGWQAETMPSKLPGCVNVILYYGSSTYDTRQMSSLIDHLISEAKELGIETATPAELERYKDEWRSR